MVEKVMKKIEGEGEERWSKMKKRNKKSWRKRWRKNRKKMNCEEINKSEENKIRWRNK